MKNIKFTVLILAVTTSLVWAAPKRVGTRVVPPSHRGYSVEAVRESGERGGMLLNVGTNFTARHNRDIGDAMALWNSHRWDEGVTAFSRIWQQTPESPWAAEAELHEACYQKFNARYDEAEDRFLSVLRKYPESEAVQNKVLRYLPHLYAQTGRYQTALDLLEEMSELPLGWQERQYLENYRRVFARAKARDDEERLCGTKALALALAAQNGRGESLRNVSQQSVMARYEWAARKSSDPRGYSLRKLAELGGGESVELRLEELRVAAQPGSPVLVHLNAPAEPECFSVFRKKDHPKARPLSGHFLVVEKVTDTYVDLLDPDSGRTRWLLPHFEYRWSGAALRLPGQTRVGGRQVGRERAAALRGGCCGSPPPPPYDECEGDDGEGTCPCDGPGGPGGSGGGGPGGGGPGGCKNCITTAAGAPVYSFGLASANLKLTDMPMWSTAAKGPQVRIQLYYNRIETERMATNAGANYYAFGNKWHFNYFSHLTERPDSGVDIVLPGGRVQRFDSSYEPVDVWNQNTLTKTNGYFVLEFSGSGNKWYYNTNVIVEQHLEKIEDKYGDAVTLEYESPSGRLTNIVDAIDREFSIAADANGFITNITDSLGRSASFAYEGGDLVSMTDMGGLTTTIEYDNNHWPTKITYPNTHSWDFDYLHGSGAIYSGYSEPFAVIVTDPLNQRSDYYMHQFDYMGPVTQRDAAGNNWLYAWKSAGSGEGAARRVYYDVVNADAAPYQGTGDQWIHREFDTSGNVIKEAIANTPYSTSIGYNDAEGAWTEDVLTTNLYDARQNLLSSTVLTNNGTSLQHFGTWTNWYDANDNLIGAKNPLYQETTFGYDSADRRVAITNALDYTTHMDYDTNGLLTNRVDALDRATKWEYNSSGLLSKTTPPLGVPTLYTYDSVGRLEVYRKNGPRGMRRTNVYDNLDRIIAVSDSYGYTNYFQYGCCGLEYTKDRLGRETFYEHDELGRVSRVTDPLSRITDFKYNGADQITDLITFVDGAPRVKKFEHASTNGATRLTKVTTPMGKTTDHDYTFRGWLDSRVDGMGQTSEFHYNQLGRLRSVTQDTDTLLSMKYDVLSQVTNVVSVYSEFDYKYDALNRATQAVCTISGITGFSTVKYTIDYQYDAVGNLTHRVISGVTGLSDTITTQYGYDAMDRLTSVAQLTNGTQSATSSYAYHNQGQMNRKTYGNGDVVDYTFDNRESRLLSMTIENGATEVRKYEYLWNEGNQILAITNGSDVVEYAYDAAGQLTNEVTSTETNNWEYDEAGNWLNADATSKWAYNHDNELVGRLDVDEDSYTNITVTGEVDAGAQSNKWYYTWADCRGVSAKVNYTNGTFSLPDVPVYPGHNALVVSVTDVSGNVSNKTVNVTNNSVTLDETFLHDGNGSLTNWVRGSENWTYEWDWADRLTKVSSNGVVLLQNWYDANFMRIAKQEIVSGQTNKSIYLRDGWEIVGVMNGAGGLQETFTRGSGIAGDIGALVSVTHHTGTNAGTYYTQNSHRGDVVMLREGATTTASYEYSAFGILASVTGTDLSRFKFSGKEMEKSCAFTYYGYRFYSPDWQRWVNRDPVGEFGGMNLYGFTGNAPIDSVDSDGLSFIKCLRAIRKAQDALDDAISRGERSAAAQDAMWECINGLCGDEPKYKEPINNVPGEEIRNAHSQGFCVAEIDAYHALEKGTLKALAKALALAAKAVYVCVKPDK